MNDMRILWLDDMRDPFNPDFGWVHRTTGIEKFDNKGSIIWCKNFDAFVDEVKYRMPDIICFDHDLGEGKSGYAAAKWLVDYCLETGKQLPGFYSQSSNPVGREMILGLLNNFKTFIQDEHKA